MIPGIGSASSGRAKEICDLNVQHLGDVLQARWTDSHGARFVSLKLSKRDADTLGEAGLREPSLYAASAEPPTDLTGIEGVSQWILLDQPHRALSARRKVQPQVVSILTFTVCGKQAGAIPGGAPASPPE